MGEVQGFVAGLKEAAQRLRGSGSGKETAGISGGRCGRCAGLREAEEGDGAARWVRCASERRLRRGRHALSCGMGAGARPNGVGRAVQERQAGQAAALG